MMTESPLKKSLLMKRSLLTACEALPPLPVLGICEQQQGLDSSYVLCPRWCRE